MTSARDILTFWEAAGGPMWYAKDDAFDRSIRAQFLALWQDAHDGGLTEWLDTADGALARIILLDQFPRNMFREDPGPLRPTRWR